MLPARLGSLLTREPLIAQTRRSRCSSAAVSTRPSQYAAKAFSFSVTQAKTSCASVGESWPVTTLGTGPTATIAVLAIVIRLPWVTLT